MKRPKNTVCARDSGVFSAEQPRAKRVVHSELLLLFKRSSKDSLPSPRILFLLPGLCFICMIDIGSMTLCQTSC